MTTDAPAPERPAPGRSVPMHLLSRAMGAGAAIEAARRAGVFDALDQGLRTGAAVAGRTGLEVTPTVLLLDALVDVGLLRRDADRYEPLVGAAVVETVGRAWDGLPQFLRSGAPVLRLDEGGAAARSYPAVVGALGDVPDAVLDATAARIGDPGARLLDMGAGAAPWSRALCRRHPGLRAVAVDLPEVAEVARRAVAADGLGDRVRVVAGDLFRVELGTGFDTVLVSGVCRLFGEVEVRTLLGRAAEATAPGGQIVVIDALPDDDRRDGASVGLYALGLALRTGRGRVHGFADYAAWLFAAGFVQIETEPLGTPEQVLVRARRPG